MLERAQPLVELRQWVHCDTSLRHS